MAHMVEALVGYFTKLFGLGYFFDHPAAKEKVPKLSKVPKLRFEII